MPGTIILDHPFIGLHADNPPSGSYENVDVLCLTRIFELSCDSERKMALS